MMPDDSSRYPLSEFGIDLIEIAPKSSRSTLYRTGIGLSERKSPPWGDMDNPWEMENGSKAGLEKRVSCLWK
ncbi:Retinol dehydrogenase [Corchorus olitorius]|uniref:Retinol dehydrogenase n=1 Tax=Corchorus olitorius TaxID=93759 RepID=A0A1R3IB13_9ROSI|nr:Retinol dehydrogenase [Corchorus olitorius]